MRLCYLNDKGMWKRMLHELKINALQHLQLQQSSIIPKLFIMQENYKYLIFKMIG